MKVVLLSRRNRTHRLKDLSGKVLVEFPNREMADEKAMELPAVILNHPNPSRKLAHAAVILGLFPVKELSAADTVLDPDHEDYPETVEHVIRWSQKAFEGTSVTALAHRHKTEGEEWGVTMRTARAMYQFCEKVLFEEEE